MNTPPTQQRLTHSLYDCARLADGDNRVVKTPWYVRTNAALLRLPPGLPRGTSATQTHMHISHAFNHCSIFSPIINDLLPTI